MHDTPKIAKRALRELAVRAHEIELGRELRKLHDELARWQRGEITAFDVSDAIHRFHDGPSREMHVRYTTGLPAWAVAHAISAGIIDRGHVPPDVLEHLAAAIDSCDASNEDA